MSTLTPGPMQAENVKVLKEEKISQLEMEKKLSKFLRKKHICDRLSKEDWTRLKALQETLLEQQKTECES